MSVCERRLLKLDLCTFESTTEYLASPHRGAPIRGATIATLPAWRSTCQSATQAMHLEQLKLENESISHSGIFFFIALILKGVCQQKPIAQRTKESHTNSLGLGMWLMHVTQQNSMDDMDHQTADGYSDIEQTSKANKGHLARPETH